MFLSEKYLQLKFLSQSIPSRVPSTKDCIVVVGEMVGEVKFILALEKNGYCQLENCLCFSATKFACKIVFVTVIFLLFDLI